jgi:hypothetical protein
MGVEGAVMRLVRVDKNREVEVPTTWAEGEAMITNALGAYYDTRGKNLAQLSCASRVADFLASVSWPPIQPSGCSFCSKKSADARARGLMVWKSRADGRRSMKRRSKREQHA